MTAQQKIFRAIGLMSGTSLDGIDVALLETNGHDFVRPLAFVSRPYDAAFREQLRSILGSRDRSTPNVIRLERDLTEHHASAVKEFVQLNAELCRSVDVIGFHGQTIWHAPQDKITIQIGDGALLARLTGIAVVNDFRSADVAAGGHGAPLVPLYHAALSANLPKPVVILNIGGVANITWIGSRGGEDILAFDTGPGNALIDDWVLQKKSVAFDRDGVLASQGKIDASHVTKFMQHPYFEKVPPKSLDRNGLVINVPAEWSAEDGAATLTMMTARSVAQSLTHVAVRPQNIYVTGGGRLNKTLMRWIGELTKIPVAPVDKLGWNGDALEAEAFAYLAVRSMLGLPISLPSTTGVAKPMAGGRLYKS